MATGSLACLRWRTPLLAAVAGILLFPASAPAQERLGFIEILSPREWISQASRSIRVRERDDIRIRGRAYQPGGVARITIDGVEVTLSPQADSTVLFTGYATADTVPRDVEIVAHSAGPDLAVRRTFPYMPTPAPAVFVNSIDAWTDSEGTFGGERYAVVIGLSSYADAGITALTYADDDAESFRDFLLSDASGLQGFKPENVTFLSNEAADTRSIRSALSGLRVATEDDIVVVYWAGHGAPDRFRSDEYYLLTHDTDAGDFAGTALSMEDFEGYLDRIEARDILLFTDACHSASVSGGAGLRGVDNAINEQFLNRLSNAGGGFLTFTASETNQYSRESTQWGGGHGVFTYYLLRGLEGAADENGDRIVTVGEMVEYTRQRVQRETGNEQVPFIGPRSFDRSMPMAITAAALMADQSRPSIPEPGSATDSLPPTALLEVDQGGDPEPILPPGGEEILPPPVEVDLVSSGGAFFQSLILPGTGQMRTGRAFRGFLVFAGVAGAAAYTYASRTSMSVCSGPKDPATNDCFLGEYLETRIEYPYLIPAAAGAAALTFIGALDALFGARDINRERLSQTGAPSPVRFTLLPTEPDRFGRRGDVRLLEIRFR